MVRKLIGQAGIPWINLMIAASALFISVASFYVAARESWSLEQMLKADTWPYLTFKTGNWFDGVSQIRLAMANSGVGPARLESFEVWYDGKPVKSAVALLEACCGTAEMDLRTRQEYIEKVGPIVLEEIHQVLIPAREEIIFFQFPEETANKEVFAALDRERRKLKKRACYCSVLDDCWVTEFDSLHPQRVKSCSVKGTVQYR